MKQSSSERLFRVGLMESAKDAYRHYKVADQLKGLMNCREKSYNNHACIVMYNDGTLGISDVSRCRNIACCPCCSYGVSMKKRNEIAQGIWKARKMGYGVYIITYTFRHVISDELDIMMKRFSYACETMCRNGSYRRYLTELGYIGKINNYEIRIGGIHGYHPHIHQLLFMKDDLDFEQIQDKFVDYWMDALKESGLTAKRNISCKIEGYKGVGDYITKMSSELTVSNFKYGKNGESFSPFQWLCHCRDTMEDFDWLMWLDFVKNIRYKRIIGWSRGLRDILHVKLEKDDLGVSDVLISIYGKNFDSMELQGLCEECNNDIDNVLIYLEKHNIDFVKSDENIVKFLNNNK